MSGSTETGTRDVRTSLREMWATRPVRSGADRVAAGVAGAVARRYAVDPLLVRVAFVVLALSGGGLVLYLAGWAALPPDPADPPRRGRAHHGPAGSGGPGGSGGSGRRPRGGPPVALLVVVGVVALATLGPGVAGRFGGVVGVLVALVLLVSLHSARASLGVVGARGVPVGGGPGGDAPAGPRPGAGEPTTGTPTTGAPTTGAPTTGESRPPGWDPLGAAPFAWDLPEPPAAPVAPAPRSRLTPVTLALALLVAGGVGVLGLTGVVDPGPATVAASALAVVGLGLLVAAFRPGGRGLLIAAVPLAVVTVVSAGGLGAGPGAFRDGLVDDVSAEPATAALVAPEYRTGLGDVDLDLRLAAATGPVRTTVSTGAGDVTVLVPTTADVTVSCRSAVGDVDCPGATSPTARLLDPGPDGPGGPVVDLDLSSGAGDLAVDRG